MSKRLCFSLLSAPQRSWQSTCLLQRHRVALTCTSGRDSATSSSSSASTLKHQHRRAYHASPTHRVSAGRMAGRGRSRSKPSIKVQQAQQMKQVQASGQAMDYIGLIDSFVPPTGQNVPKDWSTKWKMAKLRMINWYKRWIVSPALAVLYIKPRVGPPKLGMFKAASIAKGLYEEMYMAFAQGETEVRDMEKTGKLNPNFAKSLRKRIAQRPQGRGLRWKLHGFVGRPKCVSFQFAMLQDEFKLPKESRSGLVQAIVKIRSRQSLIHLDKVQVKDLSTGKYVLADVPVDRDGNEIPDDKMAEAEQRAMKENVEYFVVEKVLRWGEWQEWRAWGTAQETTVETLKMKEKQRQRELGV